ncbi:hypothetical protein WN944_006143 [Citrus x changshan-huyou]|uniref:Disease resistance protein n=1 Tax=Citrus x changshan-huyou TaxID=2935761 RepID=A0AAP0QT90_9ROSI
MPSSYIDHSPEDIWMMQKLSHLNFGSITLPAPPKNYYRSLKNLIFISALHPRSCTPYILGRLPNVQTLRISGDLSHYHSGVSKSLFLQLKILHLKSMLWLEEWTMGAGAMPKLESLIMNPCAYLRKLPEELRCRKSLRKLELHWPQPELRQRLRAFENMEWRYDIQFYPSGI